MWMGHRRRIEWRRIFPVVPVIGRMSLLLMMRLESIRVVGLGTGDFCVQLAAAIHPDWGGDVDEESEVE
jgi:hypothetical protein